MNSNSRLLSYEFYYGSELQPTSYFIRFKLPHLTSNYIYWNLFCQLLICIYLTFKENSKKKTKLKLTHLFFNNRRISIRIFRNGYRNEFPIKLKFQINLTSILIPENYFCFNFAQHCKTFASYANISTSETSFETWK